MTRRSLIALLCLPVTLVAGRPAAASPAQTAGSGEILVSAAASLTDALSEIARTYEQETRTHVALNFGASSALARQIAAGAPVDVFVSADEAQMDAVANAGQLDASSRVDLLGNQLVIVMAAGAKSIASANDLTAPSVRRIALADPAAVPAGVYARRYLESQGLWSAIEPKVVPTLDVRAALAAVDAGNADAAFVYRTDAAIARRAVIVFQVPIADGPRVVYPAAVVKRAPHAAAARAFLAYLRGPTAQRVFNKYGFVVNKEK
jgi:molybdate transport system substrate-binding protein